MIAIIMMLMIMIFIIIMTMMSWFKHREVYKKLNHFIIDGVSELYTFEVL